MRLNLSKLAAILLVTVLTTACSIPLAEEPFNRKPAYPLWDHESVTDYAKKVNLPPTKTLHIGAGVTMELVLIPAGKFIMGTPEPTSVDEEGSYRKIVAGQALLAASAGVLLVMLAFVVVRAIRQKQRPQLSLGRLLLVTIAAGGCVLCGLHWRQSALGLEAAKVEYAAAIGRFKNAWHDEKPSHNVTLTKPFYIGKFAVTQEQYQEVTGKNPGNIIGKDNPVEQVSWDEAQKFCEKLTGQTKQTARLPTEAEWEHACRAGTTTTYHSGDTEADLGRAAWYSANSKSTTHPVGQKEANAFGLYDMHGNVWQWCEDWYGEDYYAKAPAEDPQGPAQAMSRWSASRVLRGGSWYDSCPMNCRSASRHGIDPDRRDDIIGFRVVVVPASRSP